MSIFMPGRDTAQLAQEIEKLSTLAEDLERYLAHGRRQDELDGAPVIDRWSAIQDPTAFRISGIMVGHPGLGSGLGLTSQVYGISQDRTWVRTLSRVWRLGRPANDDERSDA